MLLSGVDTQKVFWRKLLRVMQLQHSGPKPCKSENVWTLDDHGTVILALAAKSQRSWVHCQYFTFTRSCAPAKLL